MANREITEKVIRALEDDKYQWRTVRGVASSTGLAEEEVLAVIEENEDLIVRSSVPSKSGEALFTTRKHSKGRGAVFGKILGAFKGRVR